MHVDKINSSVDASARKHSYIRRSLGCNTIFDHDYVRKIMDNIQIIIRTLVRRKIREGKRGFVLLFSSETILVQLDKDRVGLNDSVHHARAQCSSTLC